MVEIIVQMVDDGVCIDKNKPPGYTYIYGGECSANTNMVCDVVNGYFRNNNNVPPV